MSDEVTGPCSTETVTKELPDPQQAPEPLDSGSAFPLQCSELGLAVAKIIPGRGNLWQMGSADFPDDGILHVQTWVTGTSHSNKVFCCSLMLRSSVCNGGKFLVFLLHISFYTLYILK